jgi:diguanylate cyclase (GGDEF)-like protein
MEAGRPVILVAEDSLVVRALLRAQLREQGYAVVEAADGEQALSRVRESPPDVILLDVEMPRMDGYQVLAELKADPELAAIPVIFVSGRTTADDAVRGLTRGAHDYLRKPFEAAELAARVHSAVRTTTLQDRLRGVDHEVEQRARTDALTGLPNRSFAQEELERLVARSTRHRRPLTVLLLGLDGFRGANDAHGPEAADRALVAFARRLSGRLRADDLLARWSGDEFLVVAPEIEEPGALVVADALRKVVSATAVPVGGGEIRLTASVGVAIWREDDLDGLLRRAEDALAVAKAGGRDRTESG